jgi:hypothetical protein
MTKLQAVISRFQTLPLEEQDKLADLLNDFTMPEEGEYIFSDEEWAEIKERRETNTETFTVVEVLKALQ